MKSTTRLRRGCSLSLSTSVSTPAAVALHWRSQQDTHDQPQSSYYSKYYSCNSFRIETSWWPRENQNEFLLVPTTTTGKAIELWCPEHVMRQKSSDVFLNHSNIFISRSRCFPPKFMCLTVLRTPSLFFFPTIIGAALLSLYTETLSPTTAIGNYVSSFVA